MTAIQKNTFNALVSYTGITGTEELSNAIEIILNDSHCDHLGIIKENFNLTEEQIICLQNVL